MKKSVKKSKVKAQSSLEIYRRKRDPEQTAEPFGGGPTVHGYRFVVHYHAARRLHYDLRLEVGGVLWSWAIPKGPSPNPSERRLAVKVEDHPVEYADFEGLIPEGNYGAGATIVWDRGVWVPHGDPEQGLHDGKLLFDLRGHKLHGRWTLVKTREDWLFIKEIDSFVREASTDDYPPDSVLSGHTVATLGQMDVDGKLRRLAMRAGARPKRLTGHVRPMLAQRADTPFDRKGWGFEIKYDGYRMLAVKDASSVVLYSRAGGDLSAIFPDVTEAVRALPTEHALIDGEVVVHDPSGRPSFALLQSRGKLQRRTDIARAAVALPATLYALDLLAVAQMDLRPLPLRRRKQLLESLLPTVGTVRYVEYVETEGRKMFDGARALGLEGLVAKQLDAPYISRRSDKWLKIVGEHTGDFVVVGFTPRKNGHGLGALLIAEFVDDTLTYRGRVGSGFTAVAASELLADLMALPSAKPLPGVPLRGDYRWVDADVVVEVRYKEVNRSGHLRQPVFTRVRLDKAPSECVSHPVEPPASPPPAKVRKGSGVVERKRPVFSNVDKVFWPEDGLTKGELLVYYESIAPWILPYLRERPLVLTRFPDGIYGKSFFQHDAPTYAQPYARLERIFSGHKNKDISSFIIDSVDSLLYVINLGAIPLHVWSSRLEAPNRPDWCVLDLDPKDAPFTSVVTVARAILKLAQAVGLPTGVKSTGSSGLHIHIPLGGQATHEQSRTLAELLARVVVHDNPEIATIARRVSQRQGRVYVDYGQNGHGRLTVCPFAVRPLPGAPVAMPLRWSEVNSTLDIRRYHLKNAARRMRSLTEDPLGGALSEVSDLLGSLEALSRQWTSRRR